MILFCCLEPSSLQIVNRELISDMKLLVISGPPSDTDHPSFQWMNRVTKICEPFMWRPHVMGAIKYAFIFVQEHLGMPDKYDFDWQIAGPGGLTQQMNIARHFV
eukprot:Protomagalhaensia_wolfi_Nauph_80__1052@NODE_1610_length_1445_cov_32_913229_g1246_i0_p1_GENE_NODE_1610_length_1445_cov_32_913229_g1246_i0NODE_1610_length_1445_cov_32_913229_g1246_i0_p1_ORF_typecomplete_len104_score16_58Phospholip_B/PF04916_13/0_00039_NODE_1610_length_1445_cov_32_913229_g1246_i03314